MQDISSNFLPDTVTVKRKLAPASGKAGGEKKNFADWSAPIACAIYPASSDTLIQAGQPDLVNAWEIHFPADPDLDDGDLVQPETGGKPLVVKGRLRWAGNLFVILAQGRM